MSFSSQNKCFFCSAPISESNFNQETLDSSINSYTNYTENIPIILEQHLYQISNYLHLPKWQIDQYNLPSSLTCCLKCQEISVKLSNLCGDLEVTKMKINYYLNLLTDQILTKPENADNYQHDQLNMSSFQDVFQDKCLTTLSRTNVNPQLILQKCQTPHDTQPTDNLLEQPDSDNLEDDYQEPYTPEYQQETEDFQVQNLIAPGQINHNHPQRKLYDRSSRRCEYCDKMISYTNLSSHKRMVHGIIPTVYRPNKPFCYSKLKRRVNCEFCERNVSYRNLSTHKKYYCAVLLNKNTGKRKERVKQNEKDKFVDKSEDVKKLLQTCGYCGQVVLKEGFKDHEQLWCPITKGKVGNGFESDGMSFERGNQNTKIENEEEWSGDVQMSY